MVDQLALNTCRDTRIGSQVARGISGARAPGWPAQRVQVGLGHSGGGRLQVSCTLLAGGWHACSRPALVRAQNSSQQQVRVTRSWLAAGFYKLGHKTRPTSKSARRRGAPAPGGQCKRTNIGIALVSNPRVLFLDEPTSGLDSYTANEVR